MADLQQEVMDEVQTPLEEQAQFYLFDDLTMQIPLEPGSIVFGKNGMFRVVVKGPIRALVPAKEAPMIAPLESSAQWRLPAMPAHLTMQVIKWFVAVWHKYHSEAILIIRYNPETQEYALVAPKQRVSAGHAHYTQAMLAGADDMPGFVNVGTVHSHGSMGAFHSSVDTGDEEFFSGIHLTVGKVNSEFFEIVSTLDVNGHRFPQDPVQIFDGLKPARDRIVPSPATEAEAKVLQEMILEDFGAASTNRDMPDELKQRIQQDWSATEAIVKCLEAINLYRAQETAEKAKRATGFTVVLPDEVPKEDGEPPVEWMEQVEGGGTIVTAYATGAQQYDYTYGNVGGIASASRPLSPPATLLEPGGKQGRGKGQRHKK
ncbi:MAG: hypothetical protein ABIG71_02885 [Candidatus Uhrbacteria bacterium]